MSDFDRSVMKAIRELGENAYGVPIRQRANAMQGCAKYFSTGELYCILERLEESGLIRSYEMPGSEERGFRQKRHYYLTREGTQYLEAK